MTRCAGQKLSRVCRYDVVLLLFMFFLRRAQPAVLLTHGARWARCCALLCEQRVLLPHIEMDEHEFAAGLADRMFRAASGQVVVLFAAA